MNTLRVAVPIASRSGPRRRVSRLVAEELAAFDVRNTEPVRTRKVSYTKGGKMVVAALLLLVMGCGLKDTITSSIGTTGELKIVNNTSVDATMQQQKCGADSWDWQDLIVLRAGKSHTWTRGEQCYSLRAINEYGEAWSGTAIVQGGMRITLWIEW